jgi:hypothetical protein
MSRSSPLDRPSLNDGGSYSATISRRIDADGTARNSQRPGDSSRARGKSGGNEPVGSSSRVASSIGVIKRILNRERRGRAERDSDADVERGLEIVNNANCAAACSRLGDWGVLHVIFPSCEKQRHYQPNLAKAVQQP